MSPQNFWLTLKALAAYLDGDRAASEETLESLEKQLLEFDPKIRDSASDNMTLVIAQLSRLKIRMMVQ